jgi:hypothetical protein
MSTLIFHILTGCIIAYSTLYTLNIKPSINVLFSLCLTFELYLTVHMFFSYFTKQSGDIISGVVELGFESGQVIPKIIKFVLAASLLSTHN